jgi:hypothetical protein
LLTANLNLARNLKMWDGCDLLQDFRAKLTANVWFWAKSGLISERRLNDAIGSTLPVSDKIDRSCPSLFRASYSAGRLISIGIIRRAFMVGPYQGAEAWKGGAFG